MRNKRLHFMLLLSIFIGFLLPARICAAPSSKYSDTAFIELCKVGTFDKILQALNNGANVNARDEDKSTPLMKAVFYNEDDKVTELLLEKGADVNAADKEGFTPLILAASFNPNIKVIDSLLDHGAKTKVKSKNGITPLLAAAENKNDDIFYLLSKYDNDTKATTKDGLTLLMAACVGNKPLNVIKKLVEENKIDINAKTKDNWTALSFAAAENRHLDVWKYLLSKGSDINVRNKYDQSIVYLLLQENLNLINDPSKKGVLLEMFLELVKTGADINGDNSLYLYKPLFLFISRDNDLETMQRLYNYGMDILKKDKDQRTALMVAVSDNSHLDVIRWLIKVNDPRSKDKYGNTALDYISARNPKFPPLPADILVQLK